MAGPKRITLLALAIAAAFGLELQWAWELGFYEDDFLKGWGVRRDLETALGEAARDALLTDEPLFHVYHLLRFRILGDAAPALHHLLPGVAHIANLFLVYGLLRRVGASPAVALSTELVFGAFPGAGQALYWPSAIYPPLLTAVLAAFHAWISWLRTGAKAAGAAAVALHAAAVFTHEMALGALAVFVALGWVEARRDRGALPWRSIGALAAVSGAYLAVRQTNWFGAATFSMVEARALSLAHIAELAFASLNLTFGPWFWTRAEGLAAFASWPWDFWRACGTALTATFAAGWLCEREHVRRPAALAAYLAAAGLGVGLGAACGLAVFLRWFYAALGMAAAWSSIRAPERRGSWLAFGLFGVLWFGALFAPAWVYYLAFRHAYMALPGAALVLVLLLRAASFAGFGEAPAAGLRWGALCTVVALFHWAALGEVRAWAGYHADVDRVRQFVQSASPPIANGEEVVLLGFQGVRDGNPVLTEEAISEAVRLWQHDESLRGATALEAEAQGYRTTAGEPMRSYERLRLLRWRGDGVEEAGAVELASGTRIRLPHGDPSAVVRLGRPPANPE